MANLQNVVLTTKLDEFISLTSKPDIEFSTNSISFVDVTGVSQSIGANLISNLRAKFKRITSGNANMRLVLATAGSSSITMTTTSSNFTTDAVSNLRNVGADTVKAQANNDAGGGSTIDVEANECVIVSAPTTNITDRNFKANVTEITFYAFGATVEVIEGKSSS